VDGQLRVEIRSEMVGKVWTLAALAGSEVAVGDELLSLESMKMEIPVVAPVGGRIDAVHVAVGDVVAPGDLLVSIVDAAINPRTTA
jgi:biotin carboxyl carrier protein